MSASNDQTEVNRHGSGRSHVLFVFLYSEKKRGETYDSVSLIPD